MIRAPPGRANRFQQWKNVAVKAVEPRDHITGELQMLQLVITHGNPLGFVEGDIRRHQYGVSEQPGAGLTGCITTFLLELRHTIQFADLGKALKNPGKFAVRRDVCLDEHDASSGIHTAGQIKRDEVPATRRECERVLPDRDGMQIDQWKKTTGSILLHHPMTDRTQIVAKREPP